MKLYYNAGSYGSPTWTEVTNCRDLTGPDSFGEADVSRRGAGFKQYEPTLRDVSFEWEMVKDDTDTPFTTIKTNYAAKTLTEFALADGAIGTAGTTGSGGTAGSIYIRFDCKIFKFERNESLEGANLYSVVIKPCFSAHAPAYATVS
jgi:hypothetical protein